MLGTLDLHFRSTGLPSIFLRAQPWMSLGIGAKGVGRGLDAVQAEHRGIPDNPVSGNHPTGTVTLT